jgi:hypothetical protein
MLSLMAMNNVLNYANAYPMILEIPEEKEFYFKATY